jgi:hypothetical protein
LDKDSSLLTEYLAHKETINDPSYAEFIDRLRPVILEKCHGKVKNRALLFHENALVYKSHVVQVIVYHTDFAESNHPAYSTDVALINYHMFSHLKKFVRGKSLSSDDEAIATIEGYFSDLDSEFVYSGVQSLLGPWQRMVAIEGEYLQYMR